MEPVSNKIKDLRSVSVELKCKAHELRIFSKTDTDKQLVGDLVSKFERTSYAIEPAAPVDSLRFLIEARGLKQEDLCSIVPQSNLSAILAGKRKITATLAGKLGKFFGISPAVFVPK